MLKRPLVWLVISLLLFAAGVMMWRYAEQRAGRGGASGPSATNDATAPTLAQSFPLASTSLMSTGAPAPVVFTDAKFPFRLRNTDAPMSNLVSRPTALLLENALLDTASAHALPIPEHLRSLGDPGAYVVQSRGPVTEAFRAVLNAAGAVQVSYIPNNAWLVRVTAPGASLLASDPLVRAVVPFEPYFKLKGRLLKDAVEETPLPKGNLLNVVLFADGAESTREALVQLGGTLVAEDRSPFGPVVQVQVPVDGLAAVAGLPGVQLVDLARERKPATDLTREYLGVAVDSTNAGNYYGLTGSNVVVNVNDSGVDATHPDFVPYRVFGLAPSLMDPNGHGTHVAGIIGGDGSQSSSVSNASGSSLPAVPGQFRGMAPAVRIQSIGAINGGLGARSDTYLQEEPAKTNALISNNSWGYPGSPSYDIAAASYDAAVRDALPEVNGSQPVLFVFAAGNGGAGTADGQGGFPDTIQSPATAKNVITVGALEQFRDITNEVVICDPVGTTNNCTNYPPPFETITDTDDEVYESSGRGNVGIGIEGEFGRFKPDVVAPGTFVISTRSGQWETNSYYNPTNADVQRLLNEKILPGEVLALPQLVPPNTVGFRLEVSTPFSQPLPLPPLPLFASTTGFPVPGDTPQATNRLDIPPDAPLPAADTFIVFGVGNPTNTPLFVNITLTTFTTNDNPVGVQGLTELNEGLAPYYRYETGTSMAAPAVSGVLALMQEFFETTLGYRPSPALLKALVINGSRSASTRYDLQVNSVVNHQGWGAFNLANALPVTTNLNDPSGGSAVFFYEQSATNALATGDSHTWYISNSLAAVAHPMRVTLVWTDPPGNPVAAAKLVNNLDLVVTNLDDPGNPVVYFGNDIPALSDFNDPWDTSAAPNLDLINNVECVNLRAFEGTNFSVTVIGRGVNVNAVTTHPDNTVQDYALVISSGDGNDPLRPDTALTVVDSGIVNDPQPRVQYLTPTLSTPELQATLLEDQRAGENTPLLGTTNGMTNQWQFYAVTNETTFTNAAFIVFLPATLSVPRMGLRAFVDEDITRFEADLDLYVSTNAGLLTLNPGVVAGADKSLGRGGTEIVVLSNAVPGAVYYVGVKSEDHEAGQFSFFAAFSLLPFGTEQEGGYPGYAVPPDIPDGAPARPGVRQVLVPVTATFNVRRAVVTNELTHNNMGDLVTSLSHNGKFATLLNHSYAEGNDAITNYTFVFDDSQANDLAGAQHSDGPGTLQNYAGEPAAGLWLLTVVDDSPGETGRVDFVKLRLDPSIETNDVVNATINPFSWYFDVIDVPPNATNLTLCVSVVGTTPLPVELFVRKGEFPDTNTFDGALTIVPPGDCYSNSVYDLPPLSPGRYYFGIYNPNPVLQEVQILLTIELGLDPRDRQEFTFYDRPPVYDDRVTRVSKVVEEDRRIAGLEVGMVVDHPRVSDLVVHLVSPTGKRVLLVENRGGTSTNGYGGGIIVTNVFPSTSAGGPAANTNTLAVGANRGTLLIDYTFFTIPDQMRVYYDNALIYDTGLVSGSNQTFSVDFGPGADTNLVITMNEGDNADTNTQWRYTATVIASSLNYLVLTEDTDKTTTPIKFAPPPLGNPVTTATQILFDGFETTAPGTYTAPTTMNGWTVVTNQVSVVADATNAFAGNNFLALADGTISRVLPTVTGRKYQLSCAYRGPGIVSWWRGELNALDNVGANHGSLVGGTSFAAAQVNQGFLLDGIDDSVLVPASPSLNVGLDAGFTVEAWIRPTSVNGRHPIVEWNPGNAFQTHFWVFNRPNGPGTLFANIVDSGGGWHTFQSAAGIVVPNTFQHAALTYTKATGVGTLLLNGLPVAQQNLGVFTPRTTANLRIGRRLPPEADAGAFAGIIDETSVYRRALSQAELAAIYRAGAAGKFDPTAPSPQSLAKAQISYSPGETNVILGDNDTWQIFTKEFIAAQDGTLLELAGLTPGMLIDSIALTELPGDIYYLPEESLNTLVGDNAQGVWTLEFWDNRALAAFGPPDVRAWDLRFIYETVVQLPVPLEHGIAITNTIPPGEIFYLQVDVPSWASFATNELIFATDPVDVWFNQNEPPTTTNVLDTLLIPNSTGGTNTLSLVTVPPLVPGRTYYLGIENAGATTVTFAFAVEFDVTELFNGIPVTSTLDTNALPRMFFYNVSTNATAAVFEVTNLTGNATLVARAGRLPTLINFDYRSGRPGTADEEIIVFTNSTPVPLGPGRWYLGVYPAGALPLDYTIVATEFTNDFSDIITLTNAIPYPNTVAASGQDRYRFVVTDPVARLQFEILEPDADLTLVVRQGLPTPDLGLFDYQSANVGTNDEWIVVFPNSTPVPVRAGTWFLTAVNNWVVPGSYSIKATQWAQTGQPIVIVNPQVQSNSFCFDWNSLVGARYVVQAKVALADTNWVNHSGTITAITPVTTYCVPLPSPYHFFRVIEGLALVPAPPVPVAITNIVSAPGGVTLSWQAETNSQWQVEWTPLLLPSNWMAFTNVITSTNGQFSFTDDGSQSGGLGNTRYYRLLSVP